LYDAWQTGDASIAVSPLPPLAAGSEVDVTVTHALATPWAELEAAVRGGAPPELVAVDERVAQATELWLEYEQGKTGSLATLRRSRPMGGGTPSIGGPPAAP